MQQFVIAFCLATLLFIGGQYSKKPEPVQRVVLVDKVAAFGRRELKITGPTDGLWFEVSDVEQHGRVGFLTRVLGFARNALTRRSLPG